MSNANQQGSAIARSTRWSPSAESEVPHLGGFTERLVHWSQSLRGWQVAALLVVYLPLVCWLDRLAGDELILILLYLPAVAFVAVRLSLGFSVGMSLMCCFAWLFDDIWQYEISPPGLSRLVSGVLHFLCFSFIATIISRLNVALLREYRAARTDGLTGLRNMQAFDSEGSACMRQFQNSKQPFLTVFLDCDNFKSVNDILGHATGDELLQVVASQLRENLRETDICARYGGDEFVAMLPNTTLTDGQDLIERLQTQLNRAMQQRNWPVTFSIGIAYFPKPVDDFEMSIRLADQLMYECKNVSKNGIVVKSLEEIVLEEEKNPRAIGGETASNTDVEQLVRC